MAEMEEEVINEEVIDTPEDNEEAPENGDGEEVVYSQDELKAFNKLWIDPYNATTEDLKALAKRALKAEERIIAEKKEAKQKPTESGEYVTKEDLQLERFLSRNPELEDSVEDLKKHLARGLNLEQAKLLVENDDKTLQNRKKTNAMNITRSEGTRSIKSEYSKAELGKLSDAEYEKIVPLVKAGKVRLI